MVRLLVGFYGQLSSSSMRGEVRAGGDVRPPPYEAPAESAYNSTSLSSTAAYLGLIALIRFL